jgi:hypothetical protein
VKRRWVKRGCDYENTPWGFCAGFVPRPVAMQGNKVYEFRKKADISVPPSTVTMPGCVPNCPEVFFCMKATAVVPRSRTPSSEAGTVLACCAAPLIPDDDAVDKPVSADASKT